MSMKRTIDAGDDWQWYEDIATGHVYLEWFHPETGDRQVEVDGYSSRVLIPVPMMRAMRKTRAALDAERAAVLRRVETVLQDIEFDVDRDALPLTAREHESYIIAKVREALEAETWTPALGSSQGLAGNEGA